MKFLKIILITIFLTGCILDGDIRDAQNRVRSMMKDPDSIKFKNVKNYKNNVVCGKLNSKNSYGAYTGYKSFISTPDGFLFDPGVDFDIDVKCGTLSTYFGADAAYKNNYDEKCLKTRNDEKISHLDNMMRKISSSRIEELSRGIVLLSCTPIQYQIYLEDINKIDLVWR